MDFELSGLWEIVSLGFQVLGAVAALSVAMVLARKPGHLWHASKAIVLSLVLTAVWLVALAAAKDSAFIVSLSETCRNLSFLFVIYRLFESDGRDKGLAPLRPLIGTLAFVEILNLTVSYFVARADLSQPAAEIAADFLAVPRLLFSVGALVLVHNLYAGASRQSRATMRWPASGLAILWAFDLNLYTIAYLGEGWPLEIASVRGLAVAVLAALLAIGSSRTGDALRLKPSRAVTFQTFSLLLIGIYLAAMVGIAQWLSYAGGDFNRLAALGLLTVSSAIAVLVLPSKKIRGWLRVTLAKHLFQHRYDYREEWLRFTRTIGNAGAEPKPLGQRVVQAVADIAEAPAGLLLTPGDNGDLTLASRWNWPEIEVPASAFPARSLLFFEREGFIADIDEIRLGLDHRGEGAYIPQWLNDDPHAWALVPLIHFERLVGIVVLARPNLPRKFDWEDFDLLRVVGQQLASYLAENSSQEALAESSRFEDFHRRIAFVMHDIKNLASQLSLLARNAEMHAEKKEFRDDMLVTLRNSSDKLNGLITRLSRYGTGSIDKLTEIRAAEVLRSVADRFKANGDRARKVILAECEDLVVTANCHSLEQILVHLVQNGIDASEDGNPVCVSLGIDGLNARFDIVDSGCGMSPEFVRTGLFKPFVSTKNGGFGIGAFEARELVRAMRGRLEVESREGLGSRFIVRLPLAAATDLYANIAQNEKKVAS